jgi:hypothetical protein
VVASGVFPVFDTAASSVVSISRACAGGGALDPAAPYVLWFSGSDVYGRQTKPVALSL